MACKKELNLQMPPEEMNEKRFRCFCGVCHVVTGTQVCLVWYVLCTGFSLVFGMRSTLTWLIVPICVVALGIYALASRRHKYLYPFLIITVVQQLVCMLMATIIIVFALVSFDTISLIIGRSLEMAEAPSKMLTLIVVAGTVSACVLLSFVHVWQAVVIYSCLEYYEDEYRKLEEGLTFDNSRIEATGEDSRSRPNSGPSPVPRCDRRFT